MFSAPFLSPLLDRVKAILRRVARPAAEQTRGARGSAPDMAISPVMRGLARRWLSARLRALSALMRRIEAGEKPGLVVRAPTGATCEAMPAVRGAVPPEECLPRGFGWMCAFGPDVPRNGAAFVEWLNAPAARAMVLAAPQRMARLIGPILTATGQRRPEWFPVAATRGAIALPPCGPEAGWGVDNAGPRGCTPAPAPPEDGIVAPWPTPGAAPDETPPSRLAGDGGDVAGDRRIKPGGQGHGLHRPFRIRSFVRGRPPSRITSGRRVVAKNCDILGPQLSHDLFVTISYLITRGSG